MKAKHLITTAITGLTVLTGGILTSCSEDSSQSTAAAAQVAEINKAESRAQAYPALAYLPKNTTTYLTGNVTEFVNVINKLAGQNIVQLPPDAKVVETFAIGITDGSEKVLSDALAIVKQIKTAIMEGQQPDPAQLIKPAADALRNLKPIYLVITCPTEAEAKATADQLSALGNLAKMEVPFLKTSQQGAWSIISCTISEIPQELSNIDLSACGDLTISIATCTQGKAVIMALTANPAELQAPATAADSVLATTHADALDDAVTGKGLAALTISPNLANALRDYTVEYMKSAISIYNTMALHAGQTEGVQELIAAGNTLINFWEKLAPHTKHPYSITLWQDGDIHLTLQGDANGLEFSSAQLNTTIPQDAILYAYGTGITNYNAPSMADFDNAAQALYTIISITDSERSANECRFIYEGIKTLLPALSQLRNGLGSGWSIIADMSAVIKQNGAVDTQLPAFCLRGATQLADRATFEGGIVATINNIKAIMETINPGSSAGIDELLATVIKTRSGNYTTYSHEAVVDERDGLNAGAVISDSAIGIGSDIPQTIKLCDSLSGNTSVSGIVVNVNLAPIEQMMQSELDFKKKRYETLNNSDDDMYNFGEDEIKYLESELEEFRQTMKRVSGGNLTITSQNGCLQTHIKLNTPALK